jgi:hypothetical protein
MWAGASREVVEYPPAIANAQAQSLERGERSGKKESRQNKNALTNGIYPEVNTARFRCVEGRIRGALGMHPCHGGVG